jgi:CRP/FNR family transcriptional regulator, anaerobic regulatory protein
MKRSQIESAWKGNLQCQNCAIRNLVLFADLEESDFSLIHIPIDEIDLEVGETLYSAGSKGEYLYTIRSGLLKLVQYLPDGVQRTVRLLKPSTTAGLEVTLGRSYEHAAIALQPTAVCRIPHQVVERLSRETPRLHGQLMHRWYEALRQADDWLTELSTGKAVQRLARLLIRLVEPDGTVTLFSREDLGAMLGITTEHASRTVAELKRHDAIFEMSSNRYRCDLDQLECIGAADC